jgi:hypothetical protein
MINRKALIIGYPGIYGGENYCEGVLHDLNNYQNYFESIHGGAWEITNNDFSKIEVFQELSITRGKLDQYIEYFNSCAEYFIFVFAGHGEYHNRYGTIIQLNEREEMPVSEIFLNANRQLFIIDCCRKVSTQQLIENELKKSLSLESYFSHNRDIYREHFNQLINNSIEGNIEIYSCSINEYSIDISGSGGLFSNRLLNSATGNENLTIFKTFETAKPLVQLRSRNRQNPVIEKPRMKGISFPFYMA